MRGVETTVRRGHFGECSATRVQGHLDAVGGRLQRRLVEETDETDNGTSVALRIEGNRVRRVARSACA
ncbi:MAG: hypothetical protein ACR2JD_04250 [Nocardioides sp.]